MAAFGEVPVAAVHSAGIVAWRIHTGTVEGACYGIVLRVQPAIF